jgi:hypothetical protein
MDVITHLTPTRRTPSAPHGAQQHTLRVTPDMHVDACVPTVKHNEFRGGTTEMSFTEREKQGCFSRSLHGWIHGGPRRAFQLIPRLSVFWSRLGLARG